MHKNESLRWHACVHFCLLTFCLTAPGKWKNFTGSPFEFLFHDSGCRESFLQVPKAHLLVVTMLLEHYLPNTCGWLECPNFPGLFTSLHMKSNAEKVNCLWSLYIKLTWMAWVSEWYYRTKQKMAVYFFSIVNLLYATVWLCDNQKIDYTVVNSNVFSLCHTLVMLISSLFTFLYRS